ncbi:MAG: hypothetical protein VR64_12575 [Desulfatitalea sp. BRH_c12]|nr:MAG: hypothetical protein VR64_12575 [Desulfatitalea sp. BRH_c12]
MSDPGNVRTKKFFELFSYLVEKRVIISMYVVGGDFERLTCITGIKEDVAGHQLLVDMPDGFEAVAKKFDPLHLRFNFNGPDQLEYIFTTRGGCIAGRELAMPFPDVVERIQRRKNFRMETPVGTKMLFKINNSPVVFALINISLGGAFGALIKHGFKDLKGSLLTVSQKIYNAGIVVPAANERAGETIIIKRSEVRRIEHDRDRNLYRYALEFIDIDPVEKRKLTQAIYHFQRIFLQRR